VQHEERDEVRLNEKHGTAPARLVGDPAVNCQGRDVKDRITRTDTIGESNSIGIRSTAKTNYIVEKARGAVTAKYPHHWTQEHTFKQNLTLTVKPGDIAWVTAAAPIYRHTGIFVLTLGNTTWTLKDIQFDTPDPTQAAGFTAAERALAPAEYKKECTEDAGETGLTDAPASWVSTHRIGSDGHN
jgi:hypothetical protein